MDVVRESDGDKGGDSNIGPVAADLFSLLEDDASSPFLEKAEKFAFAHCDDFRDCVPRNSSADPTTEYPLALYEVHGEYTRLLEDEIVRFLRGKNTTSIHLVNYLKHEENSQLATRLLRVIESLTDIDVFVQMLADATTGPLLATDKGLHK